MDIFGIGLAFRGCIEVCCRLARGTGRTTRLLNVVRDGDLVIFATRNEAENFEKKLEARDIRVTTALHLPDMILQEMRIEGGKTGWGSFHIARIHDETVAVRSRTLAPEVGAPRSATCRASIWASIRASTWGDINVSTSDNNKASIDYR